MKKVTLALNKSLELNQLPDNIQKIVSKIGLDTSYDKIKEGSKFYIIYIDSGFLEPQDLLVLSKEKSLKSVGVASPGYLTLVFKK